MVVKLLTLTHPADGKTRLTRYVNPDERERGIDVLHVIGRVPWIADGTVILLDEHAWTMPMAFTLDSIVTASCVAFSAGSIEGNGTISTVVNVLPWTGGLAGPFMGDVRTGAMGGLCAVAGSRMRITNDDPIVGYVHNSADCSDVTPTDVHGVLACLVLDGASPYLVVFSGDNAFGVAIFYSPIDICNLSEGMALTNTLAGDGSELSLPLLTGPFVDGGSGGTVTINFCVEALVPESCVYVHRFSVVYRCADDTFDAISYDGLTNYDPFVRENRWELESSTMDDDDKLTCTYIYLICSTDTDEPEAPSTDSVVKSACNCDQTITCGDEEHEHCEGTNESALPSTALVNLAGIMVVCLGEDDVTPCYTAGLDNVVIAALDANTMTEVNAQYDGDGNEAVVEPTVIWKSSSSCWTLLVHVQLGGACGTESTWYGIKSGGSPTGTYNVCLTTGCVDWPLTINVN